MRLYQSILYVDQRAGGVEMESGRKPKAAICSRDSAILRPRLESQK